MGLAVAAAQLAAVEWWRRDRGSSAHVCNERILSRSSDRVSGCAFACRAVGVHVVRHHNVHIHIQDGGGVANHSLRNWSVLVSATVL